MSQPCTKEVELKETRDIAVEGKTSLGFIQKDIYDIKNNHLAHMQASLESMEAQINKINITMAKWLGGAVVVLAIVQYVVDHFEKLR